MIDVELRRLGFGPILVPGRWWRPSKSPIGELVEIRGDELVRWDADAEEFRPTSIDALGADRLEELLDVQLPLL